MAMTTTELRRVFKYNSVDLPDPGAGLSAEDVRELLSATYPEILNATIEGPEEKDGQLVYTFKRAVGTKGLQPQVEVDLRARLQAIADGKGEAAVDGELPPAAMELSHKAFQAWAQFARDADGEALVAPAEALAPLP